MSRKGTKGLLMDESELRVVKAESPATNCAPSPGVASACPIQYLVRFAAEVVVLHILAAGLTLLYER